MSNSLTRYETYLTSIANGEASKLVPITRKEMFLAKASGVDVGDITPITREEMFLNKISSGGGELEIYIEGAPTLVQSNATKIPDRAFYELRTLQEVQFDNAISVGREAFMLCTSLEKVNFGKLLSVGDYAFANTILSSLENYFTFNTVVSVGNFAFSECGIKKINLSNAVIIGKNAFNACHNLTIMDLPKATTIGEMAFVNSHNIKALILRSPTLCDIDASAIIGTKIIDLTGAPTGEGFVYVLTALYESYITDLTPKIIAFATANNMPMDEATATYIATAILRKLEDYTVDGTTTGELDESKI